MKAKNIFVIIAIYFFIFSLISQVDAVAYPDDVIVLDSLIKEALSNNPRVISAKKKYEIEKAKITQQTALDNPWIGAEFEDIPKGQLNFRDAEVRKYSVSQEIPFPTKIMTRTKAQRESANAAYQRYREKEREIIKEVKSAYSKLFLTYKEIDTNKENKALVEQLAKTASARFSLNKASQQDALKAQVEIAKIDNDLIMLEQKRQVQAATLNVLLNRPVQQELGLPRIGEQIGKIDGIDKYYALAKDKRPELLALRSEIKRQKAVHALAAQGMLPDFMVEARQREMDYEFKGWDAMVKMSVPLWFMQKQTYEVKEAWYEVKTAEAEYKSMENITLLEVKEAHSMIKSLMELAILYRTSFIPQAEQTLKASLAGYETGQVDFLNLLDSQRMLLDFKLGYYGVLVRLEIAKADLEQAVGIDLGL